MKYLFCIGLYRCEAGRMASHVCQFVLPAWAPIIAAAFFAALMVLK